MGDSDGMIQAIAARGTNQMVKFDGGYFSFAFGSEIALCLEGSYYTLNCGQELFDKVTNDISEETTREEAVSYWKEKANGYDLNAWSNDFSELD